MRTVIPVLVPEDQADLLRDTAKELDLSQQDVIRQTLKLYLGEFRDRMSPKPKLPRRISLWDALHFGRGIELDIKPVRGLMKKVTL
jgi:hypothetical protein